MPAPPAWPLAGLGPRPPPARRSSIVPARLWRRRLLSLSAPPTQTPTPPPSLPRAPPISRLPCGLSSLFGASHGPSSGREPPASPWRPNSVARFGARAPPRSSARGGGRFWCRTLVSTLSTEIRWWRVAARAARSEARPAIFWARRPSVAFPSFCAPPIARHLRMNGLPEGRARAPRRVVGAPGDFTEAIAGRERGAPQPPLQGRSGRAAGALFPSTRTCELSPSPSSHLPSHTMTASSSSRSPPHAGAATRPSPYSCTRLNCHTPSSLAVVRPAARRWSAKPSKVCSISVREK